MMERESDDSLVVGLAGCSKIRGARAVLSPAAGSAPSGNQARRPPLSLATQKRSVRSQSYPRMADMWQRFTARPALPFTVHLPVL